MRPLRVLFVMLALLGSMLVPHLADGPTTVAALGPSDVQVHPKLEPEVLPPHPRYVPPVASRSRTTPVPKATHRAIRHHRTPLLAPVPTSSLKAYAYGLVGAAQFSCLEPLWQHESKWQVTDSYGSAYGIPQALPGYKMASEGADWRTNGRTQIRWGVKYIAGRYGNACGAWAHYQAHSWY